MSTAVDLVADLGEGFGPYRIADDEALLDLVSSANVACGFHAGDPQIMDATVALCAERGVAIGAHPGFPDRVGFGRRDMALSANEVRTDVLYQVGALAAFASARGTGLSHVAPHGRLGNLAVTRADYADAVARAVRSLDPTLLILTQEGELARAGRELGLAVGILGLADRAYQDDGLLVPRTQAGAVLHDDDEIADRTMRMVRDGSVSSVGGREIPVTCDSILLHGDNAGAVTRAELIRSRLEAEGVAIRPLREVLAGVPVS